MDEQQQQQIVLFHYPKIHLQIPQKCRLSSSIQSNTSPSNPIPLSSPPLSNPPPPTYPPNHPPHPTHHPAQQQNKTAPHRNILHPHHPPPPRHRHGPHHRRLLRPQAQESRRPLGPRQQAPPFAAASALTSMASTFGHVIEVSAYANRHAFIHLPHWVLHERRERRRTDLLERKGAVAPSEPYVCSVCGRKCKTNLDLKKHFKQLHERERQKKVNRMRSLKGKKRQRFKERFIDGNDKYNEAARRLLTPKTGYGLAQELTRAGVRVRTVKDKPQAADWALKRQMAHSMSRGVDWIVLVSDDSDFSEMLRKAREASLGTVVVGDRDGALGRHADVWVPWAGVESGEIRESDLELKRRRGLGDQSLSVSEFGFFDESGDRGLDEIVGGVEFGGLRISSFSKGEEEYEDEDGESDDYFSDSEDEGIEGDDDVYF